MKKIKLSPFWIAILVSGAVLLFGLVPLVVAKKNAQAALEKDLAKKAKALTEAREGTPSRGDIEAWTKYKGELVRSYGDITKYYTESDKFLERWFPNLLLGADGDPSRDTFMSRYLDEGKHLEEKLAAKPFEVKIGIEDEGGRKPRFGFNWEAIQPGDWDKLAGEEKAVLRELQKRYWARQRVANIILNSNVKVTHILDFRFFKPLHQTLRNAPWETYPSKPEEIIHWQGIGADPGSGQARNFIETDLPSELGKTMTFGFAVELPYSEVPKAIREILNPGNAAANQDILVNLIGTHVTIHDQNLPEVKYTYMLGKPGDKEAKMAEALKKAGGDKARSVTLAVTCQIIDFDPAKVKKFEAKAAN